MDQEYSINLKKDVNPYAVQAPRRIPIPRLAKVREELDYLLSLNIISRVHVPAPWCAPMVVVPKRNADKVCICCDYTTTLVN